MDPLFVIMLTVTLVTPDGQDDVTRSREMPTVSECESAAHDWLKQDVHAAGGIGLAAGCQKVERLKS